MIPTILIVDDSSSIHELVSSAFVGEPWHVCSAYAGVDGLDRAVERRPDLVLLDVDLPDMNGFDVCRSLRAAPETARTAVIFLTGSASIDETVCGLQLGAFDYVTKPFDPAVLVERVRNSLKTKRLLDRVPDLRPATGPTDRSKPHGKRQGGTGFDPRPPAGVTPDDRRYRSLINCLARAACSA